MAMAMEGEVETVDVHELFCHYNALYFDGSLGACAVSWTSDPLPSGASDCDFYYEGCCDIVLSKPVLGSQSSNCLKNVLLHEMIHAYMCIHHRSRDRSDHGQKFQLKMNLINSNTVHDLQRPACGYNIITSHDIPKEDALGKSRLQDSPALKGKGVSSKGDSPSSSQHPSKNVKRIIELDCEENTLTNYYSEKSTRDFSPRELKRRKLNKKDYAVIIEWLEVFTDEESDEEMKVPLVNKRTRRRHQHISNVTEVGAPSVSIQENETRVENESKRQVAEDKFAIGESLRLNENLSGLGAKCTNEIVEVSDG